MSEAVKGLVNNPSMEVWKTPLTEWIEMIKRVPIAVPGYEIDIPANIELFKTCKPGYEPMVILLRPVKRPRPWWKFWG